MTKPETYMKDTKTETPTFTTWSCYKWNMNNIHGSEQLLNKLIYIDKNVWKQSLMAKIKIFNIHL